MPRLVNAAIFAVALFADCAYGAWVKEAAMKLGRAQHKMAALDDHIWVAGGQGEDCENGGQCKQLQVFDPKTGKWSVAGGSMITARTCLGLAAFDSKLYAVGGWSSTQQKALADVEVFDPSNGTWRSGSPMTTGRNGLALAVLEGKLYAAGGSNTKGDNLQSVEVLVLGAKSWTGIASMKIAREGHGLVALGGKLYAVGGLSDDGNAMTSMEVYDPSKNTWTVAGEVMAAGRFQFGLAVFGDALLYAVGGADGVGDGMATVEVYDQKANKWTAGPSMITARRSFGMAYLAGSLIAAGGLAPAGFGESKSVERLSLPNSTGVSVSKQYNGTR